jgi:hypothetical protein
MINGSKSGIALSVIGILAIGFCINTWGDQDMFGALINIMFL